MAELRLLQALLIVPRHRAGVFIPGLLLATTLKGVRQLVSYPIIDFA